MPLLGFLLNLFQEEMAHGLLISKLKGQKQLAFEASHNNTMITSSCVSQEGPVCLGSFSELHLQFLT